MTPELVTSLRRFITFALVVLVGVIAFQFVNDYNARDDQADQDRAACNSTNDGRRASIERDTDAVFGELDELVAWSAAAAARRADGDTKVAVTYESVAARAGNRALRASRRRAATAGRIVDCDTDYPPAPFFPAL